MDRRWTQILREHIYETGAMNYEQWLAYIESLENEQPKARGVGLPPQRSMTPEESANLAAYHKTKFKRVAAQDDGLWEQMRKLLEIDPFQGGRDSNQCLWCRKESPRGLTMWEQSHLPEHHDSDCEFVAAIVALAS